MLKQKEKKVPDKSLQAQDALYRLAVPAVRCSSPPAALVHAQVLSERVTVTDMYSALPKLLYAHTSCAAHTMMQLRAIDKHTVHLIAT